MALIESVTKNVMLDALGDSTNGLIKIAILDDSSTRIGDYKDIAWNSASAGSMDMSTSEIEFEVPGNTTVSSVILYFYDSGTTTYTSGIIHSLETQYIYSNAGLFTITDITLAVS